VTAANGMPHNELPRLSERVGSATAWVSQRISRRSFIGRLGGTLAGAAVGGVVGQLIIVDGRHKAAQAYTGNCGDWENCGMYGRMCKNCGGNAANTVCPDGTYYSGGCWSKCCSDGAKTPTNRIFYYCDCCGNGCNSGWCLRHPDPQPFWGCGGGNYRCTITLPSGIAC
jgi:hypothetical protein